MPGQVKRNEVYQDNFYGPLGDSAKEARFEIKELTDELIKESAVLDKDLKKAMFNNIEAITKFLGLVKKANKLKTEAIQLDKAEERAIKLKTLAEMEEGKIKRDKLKTEAAEIRNAQLLERQKNMQANAERRAAKAAAEESDAYKRLSKATREQKNESKRLSVQMINLAESGKRNSKEYREVASRYREVTREAKRGDAVLKKIDATVGDNFRNVGNYGSALDKLKGSFTRIAGALGLFSAVRGITGIVVDFDQAQGDLLAISGKTADQMAVLTDQAKELGATTQFSATQITEMQIELAKLGFTTEQIQSSTQAVSNFAAATGAEIPSAAALAGSAMRAFGLEADEMERVVSTLGVATTKTALDFGFLETGLSTVAPVAKAFGFSIEDTTALLGQLANSGFDASSAATATRNILLNLADSSGDLAKELGRPITSVDDLAGALKELDDRGIDLASALELTDKRSVAAFNTFIDGADSLSELKGSITGVNDELQAMADKRLDTIGGQFTLLASAWEGFILSVNEGTGAGESIKSFIGFLANNLPEVLTWIGRLVKLFLIYKARLIALNIAQKVFNDGSGKMSVSLKTLIQNFKQASTEGNGFGKAMRGIGWTALIGLALEFANSFIDIANGALQAERQIMKVNNAMARGAEGAKENINKVNESLKERLSLLDADRRLNKISNKEYLEQKEAEIQKAKEQIEGFISTVKTRRTENQKLFFEAKKDLKDLGVVVGEFDANLSSAELARWLGIEDILPEKKAKILDALDRLEKYKAAVEGTGERINQYEESLKGLGAELQESNVELQEFTKFSGKSTGSEKARNTELKNTIDLMDELNAQTKRQIELLDELNSARSSQQVSEMQDAIDAQIVFQKMRIETERKYNFDEVKKLILERQKLEIDAIVARRDFEIQNLKQVSSRRFANMREDLTAERDELLAQANLTNDERLKIEKSFSDEMEKIRKIEEAQAITDEETIILIKENANNEILDNERQTADEIHDINKELTGNLADLIDQQKEADKKAEEEKVLAAKAAAKRRQEIAKALTDFLDKQSDERIAQIDKEIEARQAQFNRYEELAKEGNITQQQSLKAQQQQINELNKRREAEEKAKQRRQLINTTYSVYQSHVEAGDENPLQQTLIDISLLQALIETLPGFIDGTDTTVAAALGAPHVKGRDGYIVRVDGKEKILNPEHSAMTGDHTTADIANIVSDYDRGKLMRKAEIEHSNGSNWQAAALLAKMSDLEKAYKDTPDIATKIEELSDHVAYLVTVKKQGNRTIESRRRIET